MKGVRQQAMEKSRIAMQETITDAVDDLVTALYALLGARASSREAKRERESELFARDGSKAFRWGFLPWILVLKYMRCNYLWNYEAKSYIWCI